MIAVTMDPLYVRPAPRRTSHAVFVRRRIVAAARHYLVARGSGRACRFDAVLLHGEDRRIEWLEDAFGE